jgi:hypothetical protein
MRRHRHHAYRTTGISFTPALSTRNNLIVLLWEIVQIGIVLCQGRPNRLFNILTELYAGVTSAIRGHRNSAVLLAKDGIGSVADIVPDYRVRL